MSKNEPISSHLFEPEIEVDGDFGEPATVGVRAALDGDANTVTDPLGNVTTTVYDQFGRVAEVLQPPPFTDSAWPTTSYTYDQDGNLLSVTDPNGNTISYTYNDLNRKTSEIDPAPTLDGSQPTTTYGYDAFGNQVAVIDPLGSTTTYTYDSEGNQLTQTLPMEETETNYYDGLNRIIYSVSFDGVVTAYQYDNSAGGDGQLEAQYYYASYSDYTSDPGSPGESITYTYNALGQTVQTVDTTVTDSVTTTNTTINTYDEWGNLIEVQSPEGTVGYGYDPVTGEHTRTWTGSASSPTTDELYSYDALDRLTEVSVDILNGTTLTAPQNTTYEYNLDGSLAEETLANGDVSIYTYNVMDDLTDLTEKNSSGTLLADYAYTVGLDGTRTAAVEDVQQSDGTYAVTDITWTYDADNRLTEELEVPGPTADEGSVTGQDYCDKYLYADADPINMIDPSGYDGLMDLLITMSINSIIGYALSPIIKPAIAYIAPMLIPQSVINAVMTATTIDALSVSANVEGDIGYGKIPIGITGGVGLELDWSPHTGNIALYTTAALGLNFGKSNESLPGLWGGVGASVSVGFLINTPNAGASGEAMAVTVPFDRVPQTLQDKIESDFVQGFVSSHSLPLHVSGWSNFKSLAYMEYVMDEAKENAGSIMDQLSKLSLTLSVGSDGGVEVSLGLNTSASQFISVTWSPSERIYPTGDEDVPFVSGS